MKLIFACCLLLSTVFSYEAASLHQATQINPRDFDPLLDLLPLYGHLKLKHFFSLRQFNTVTSFFKGSPKIYADFQRELATVGIILPELNQLDFSVIGQNDVDIILGIVKDTPIRDAVNEEYLKYLENWFETHPDEEKTLVDNAIEAGITIPDIKTDEEKDAVLDALGRAFVPNITSFIPTVLNLAVYAQTQQWFGK